MEELQNEYRVIGPPGCGKSTYVVGQAELRLRAYMQRTGQSAIGCTDVLVTSLTKAAAAEIRGRGLEMNPDQIGTLHSHCYRALGGPKMCVGGDAIKQWNEECGGMQYMLSDGGMSDDPLGGSIGRYGGDEMLAMYGVYRSRCESRKTWRPDVTQFVDRYETWKRINGFMDFHDLIDRCLADDVPPPNRPAVIIVDECLPYFTPVHLADGSSMQIGEIVEGRRSVEVVSYDETTGEQKNCRVIGWHKLLNQKPLVKIAVKPLHGPVRSRFVVCTTDHRVFAGVDGWVEAGKLKPGMAVQVETAAITTEKGKITSRGKSLLSAVMAEKNKTLNRDVNYGGGITEKIRGGNGRGESLAERVLREALGDGWVSQFVVKTGIRKPSKYPSCYKIDIANPDRKIAVEVDGSSHNGPSRRAADVKKDDFLRSLGWKVIRVKNRDAIQRTSEAVQSIASSDCMVGAVVVSVEPTTIRDSFVYDITVEGCHNFYANGILVHNCQDSTHQELNLVRQWSKYVSKLILAGDPDQAIFSWRGATPDGFYATKIPDGHTKVLEQSYRVPRAVHAAAMKIVELIADRVPVAYHPRDEDGVLESSPHSLRSDPGPVVDEIETILATTDETVMLLFPCAYMASSAAEMLRRRGILYWNPYAPGRSRFNPFHPQHGTSTLDKVRSFLRPSREVFGDDARLWTYRELQDWSSLCNGEGWLLRGARKDIESAAKMFGQDAVSIDFLRRIVVPDFDLSELAHVNLSWLLKHRSSQSAVLMETIGMSADRIGEGRTVNADPRVIVGTVHSVKGGEAHHVYVCPDMSASGFDLFNSAEGRDATLRMLYVAVTRARKRLVLTAPGGRMAFDWSEAGL